MSIINRRVYSQEFKPMDNNAPDKSSSQTTQSTLLSEENSDDNLKPRKNVNKIFNKNKGQLLYPKKSLIFPEFFKAFATTIIYKTIINYTQCQILDPFIVDYR